jgi:hypothetical protein
MPSLRHWFVSYILPAIATLLAASAARADEPPNPFGEAGQVAFDDLVTVGIGGSRIGSTLVPTLTREFPRNYGGLVGYAYDDLAEDPNMPSGHDTQLDTVWFAPSIDVFAARGLSIGGTLAAAYMGGRAIIPRDGQAPELISARGIGFTFLPRVGYAIPLGEHLALWPRLGLGYSIGTMATVSSVREKYAYTASTCMAVADVSLVARVHRNIYFRVAPQLSIDMQDITSRCGVPSYSEHVTVEFGATAGVGLLFGS